MIDRNTNVQITDEDLAFAKPMLAEVAVYNEDALHTMSERMQNNELDLIITSPPYFNARDYSQYKSVQDYLAQMKEIFTMAYDRLKESRMCVVNISPVLVEREKRSKQSYRIPLPFYFVPMMEEIGFEFLEDIIWMKPDGAVPNRNGGFYRHRKPIAYKPNIVTEYILVFKKPAPFLIDKVIKNESLVADGYERTNVWQFNPDTSNWHPAPFPEALAERVIKYYSYENDLVYDCFAGSGTVGRVCQKLKRRAILSELKTEYYTKMVELNGWQPFLLTFIWADNKKEQVEIWFARELQSILGYARWENFVVAINRAVESCKTQGINVDDHFREVTKMIEKGSIEYGKN